MDEFLKPSSDEEYLEDDMFTEHSSRDKEYDVYVFYSGEVW